VVDCELKLRGTMGGRALFAAAVAVAVAIQPHPASAQHANTVTVLPISFDADVHTPWSSEYTCIPHRYVSPASARQFTFMNRRSSLFVHGSASDVGATRAAVGTTTLSQSMLHTLMRT
jgi:hypothetical protein